MLTGAQRVCAFYSPDLSRHPIGRRQLTGWGQTEPEETRTRTNTPSPTQNDRLYKPLECVAGSSVTVIALNFFWFQIQFLVRV